MSATATPRDQGDEATLRTAGVDHPDIEHACVGNLFIASYPDGAVADRYLAANIAIGNRPLVRQTAEGRVVIVYDLSSQINASVPDGYLVTPAEILAPVVT